MRRAVVGERAGEFGPWRPALVALDRDRNNAGGGGDDPVRAATADGGSQGRGRGGRRRAGTGVRPPAWPIIGAVSARQRARRGAGGERAAGAGTLSRSVSGSRQGDARLGGIGPVD